MTKEFLDKFVREKLEQKHVHWAPETFGNGIEEVKCEGIDEVDSIKKDKKVENNTSPKVQNQVFLENSGAKKTQISTPNPVIPGVPWYQHDRRNKIGNKIYSYDRETLFSLAENFSNSQNFPKFQEVQQLFPEILLEKKRTKVVPILAVNKKQVSKY